MGPIVCHYGRIIEFDENSVMIIELRAFDAIASAQFEKCNFWPQKICNLDC